MLGVVILLVLGADSLAALEIFPFPGHSGSSTMTGIHQILITYINHP